MRLNGGLMAEYQARFEMTEKFGSATLLWDVRVPRLDRLCKAA
jgi:hypothetical protein